MRMLVHKVVAFFSPVMLDAVTRQSVSQGFLFFSKMLLVAFVLMGFLYVPTLVGLPKYFDKEMKKFNDLSVESNFSVMAPVYFPERESLLVIDTTGLHKRLKYEWFLITHEGLYFRLFREPYFIRAESFGDVLSHKDSFVGLFIAVLVLMLPALVFWSYVFLWLKYAVLTVLLGGVFFTLFDLTHWRKSFCQMLNIAAYTSVIPVFAEIVSLPFGTAHLIPFFETIGSDLYAVPLIVHAGLIVITTFLVHGVSGKHGRD